MLDNIKKTFWAAADKPRANMDAAEYKQLVLGLNVLKYAPPREVLVAFARLLVDQIHSALIQALASLRDTLLPRLISGQLRLQDAIEAAEEAQA